MCANFHLGNDDVEEIQRIADEITKKYGPDSAERYLNKDYFPREAVPVIGTGRKVSLLRWGLPMAGSKNVIFNARAETLAEKSMFRSSLGNRCLVPATAFYEWDREKRKYAFSLGRTPVFYMAALWKGYVGKDGDKVFCFTIVTTAPNPQMQPIHNRMPAIIPEEYSQAWLSGECSPLDLLRPYEDKLSINLVTK